MECPQCGYILGPFDTQCPKCARAGGPSQQAQPPGPLVAAMRPAAKQGVPAWVPVLIVGAVVVIAGMAALGALAMRKGAARAKAVQKPIATVDASALWEEFTSDPLAAGQKYKGEVLTVTGPVYDAGVDNKGRDFVSLGGPLEVTCFIEPDQVAKLAALPRGQPIRVTGRCDGSVGFVIIRKCVIE